MQSHRAVATFCIAVFLAFGLTASAAPSDRPVAGSAITYCAPVTSVQVPASFTVPYGSPATITSTVNGSSPVDYQWYERTGLRTAERLPDGVQANYTIASVTTSRTFFVSARNDCSNGVVSQDVTVSPVCTISIISQPQSQTITSGSTATLSVEAWGSPPFTYQWYQGARGDRSTPVGTNSATFTTPALTQTTRYWATVRNSCQRSIDSDDATITVLAACARPVITRQPQNVVAVAGAPFEFSVTATGDAPLSYQWYRGAAGDESTPIAGATAPVYGGIAVSGFSLWVKVWNSCGVAVSSGAALSVGCATPAAPRTWIDPIAESGAKYRLFFEHRPGVTRYQVSEAKLLTPTLPQGFQWPPFTDLPPGETSVVFSKTNPGSDAVYYFYAVRAVCDSANVSRESIEYIGIVPEKRPQTLGALPLEASAPFGSTETVVVAKILLMPPASKTALDSSFSVTTGAPWLSASPSSGTIPSTGVTVTLTGNPQSLPVGTSTTSVSVSDGSAAPKAGTASVTLLTPVTTVPRTTPPANAMIIPAVGHAAGAAGSMFQSDVRIANTSKFKIRYALTYTPTAIDGTKYGRRTELEISPGQTVAADDILKNWYAVGLAGESGQGSLEIRPLDFDGKVEPAAGSVTNFVTVVSSRTYNNTPTGTYGQFIPGIVLSQFVGKSGVLSLQQIAQSLMYRTNVGFVEGSGQPAEIEIRILSPNGTPLTSLVRQLAAAEQRQMSLSELFAGQLADGRMEVRVLSSTGSVTAYASVVDNVTSDPLLVSPVEVKNVKASRYVIPGIGHVDTGVARWRSDLRIFNGGSSPVDATMLLFAQNSSTPIATKQVTIAAGEVRGFDNVSETFFGLTNINGVLHVLTPTESSLVVTARTYDQQASGTYGQFIPGVTSLESVGVADRALQLLQIEQSDRFRAHLGILETTGNPVTLQLTAVVPETTVMPVVQIQLGPNEFRQLPNIISMLNLGNSYNARIEIKVVGGTGRAAAYISAVDNRTQDPTYIPGQ